MILYHNSRLIELILFLSVKEEQILNKSKHFSDEGILHELAASAQYFSDLFEGLPEDCRILLVFLGSTENLHVAVQLSEQAKMLGE